MKKVFFIMLILSLSFINAGKYTDKDMDGIFDRYDKCPNSSFWDIVNRNGCTVKRLRH